MGKLKGNRNAYWLKIDAEIVRITKTTPQELRKYISEADKLIRECILVNLAILEKNKSDIIRNILFNAIYILASCGYWWNVKR